MKSIESSFQAPQEIGTAVGTALRHHRIAAGLAIRELGRASGVSPAMISRIENAQVSPSLATLDALAKALSLPVISFFQHTIRTADINFVKAGTGIRAKRFAPDHVHDYEVLGNFSDTLLKFSAARVTLVQEDNGTHPFYISHGFVFIAIIEGSCLYSCGGAEFDMRVGDSLSFDAKLRHGVNAVTSPTMSFISVAANHH